ncbi:putative U-box domain-containing protein 55 [Brassica napus]|uniref:putative U-box domain-containing protein 55 n=1 Tax=Brassica napus TaxID=3708 RepID=UPI00207A0F28|nr:putative U-box domain-containing protein 55 [Brassica napus]
MAELMAMGNDVVHVAVKNDVKESRSTLVWALRNLGAKKVCILHVYQPNTASPAARKLEELEAIMYETLHDYFDICQQEGVNEDDIYISCIEMNDVKQGILELIHESKIKKLVMGAASDRDYSEKMFDLKSRKAKYVYQHAPSSCEVTFMCNGHLIYTKEANLEDRVDETEAEAGQWKPKLYSSASPKCSAELVSAIVAYIDTRRDRDMLEPTASEDQSESDRNDQLYRQLKQALIEVEESKREAYEECVRRFKSENAAVEAIRKAREYEAMFNEETRLRKESKEALTKQRKMVEKTKQERDDALIIILNGRKLYSEELRRRVEAEEMLGKEKEEHERTKKELEEVRVIVQDGMKLYNEQLRQRKEMEESVKRQEEELEKTKKEKEEACLISKNLMQLYEDEVRQRKETEELVKRRREEVEKVRKEKEEACSVGQNFMRLYEEEARRRKGTEEELSKVAAEKDAASSVCSDILLLLQSYTRRHGIPSGFSDEDSVTRQPPSYFICPISQEVMREPRVAADGFTYEAEALKEWLDNGHETSPMTNLKLTHNNLVPNHALRSAIQEWLQRNS